MKYSFRRSLLTVNVTGTEWSPGTDHSRGRARGGPCLSSLRGIVTDQGWAPAGVPSGIWPLPLSSPALTWTPDIYIKEPLASGSGSHLTCSLPGACDWATPPTISWMGAAPDASAASNSSEILLTPRPQDHGTDLTFRVTFPRAGVSTEWTLQLNVSCERRTWDGGPPAGGRDGRWRPRGQGPGRGGGEEAGPVLLCFLFLHFPRDGVGGGKPALTPFLTALDAPRNLAIGISRGNCTGRTQGPWGHRERRAPIHS